MVFLVATTAMVVHSVASNLLPSELQSCITNDIHNMFSCFSSDITLIIDNFNDLVNNQTYKSPKTYLGAKISPNKHKLKVSKPETNKTFALPMEPNESLTDGFKSEKFI
ncbi:hypothetical protein AAZX31_01G100100 [Glycine max]